MTIELFDLLLIWFINLNWIGLDQSVDWIWIDYWFNELTDGGTRLIQATDKDGIRRNQGNRIQDGRISYSIESGNTPDGLFSIDDDDGRIDLTRRINATELGETKFFLTVRSFFLSPNNSNERKSSKQMPSIWKHPREL